MDLTSTFKKKRVATHAGNQVPTTMTTRRSALAVDSFALTVTRRAACATEGREAPALVQLELEIPDAGDRVELLLSVNPELAKDAHGPDAEAQWRSIVRRARTRDAVHAFLKRRNAFRSDVGGIVKQMFVRIREIKRVRQRGESWAPPFAELKKLCTRFKALMAAGEEGYVMAGEEGAGAAGAGAGAAAGEGEGGSKQEEEEGAGPIATVPTDAVGETATHDQQQQDQDQDMGA